MRNCCCFGQSIKPIISQFSLLILTPHDPRINVGKTCAGGGRLNTELVKTEASRFDSFSARPAEPAAAEACCEVERDATDAVAKPPARKDRRHEVVDDGKSQTTIRPCDWLFVFVLYAHV